MSANSQPYTSYSASLDKATWVVTVLVGFILLLPLALLAATLLRKVNVGTEVGMQILVAALLLGVLVVTYGYRISGYRLSSRALVICRPFRNVTIPLKNISKVRVLKKGDTGWMIRTFGVGGLFGYFGKFYSNKLGRLTLYATRTDRKVLVCLHDGHQLIISPDNLELARELQRRIKQ